MVRYRPVAGRGQGPPGPDRGLAPHGLDGYDRGRDGHRDRDRERDRDWPRDRHRDDDRDRGRDRPREGPPPPRSDYGVDRRGPYQDDRRGPPPRPGGSSYRPGNSQYRGAPGRPMDPMDPSSYSVGDGDWAVRPMHHLP